MKPFKKPFTICLAVPHAFRGKDRSRVLARLRGSLGIGFDTPEGADCYVEYHNRSPNIEWSYVIRRAALASGADYALFLEDDVLVPDDFWKMLRAMIEGSGGDQCIGLHTRHPHTPLFASEGRRWCSSNEFVGTGYVMPRAELEEAVKWLDERPRAHRVSQDCMLGVWAYVTGRRVWHPIPTIIDHDSSILSANGSNVAGAGRNPPVTWKNAHQYGIEPHKLIESVFWQLDEAAAPPHYRLDYDQLKEDLRA